MISIEKIKWLFYTHWGKITLFVHKFTWIWYWNIVIFVKNDILKMRFLEKNVMLKVRILLKNVFWKCEFFEICDFEHVNFGIKFGFLPQCVQKLIFVVKLILNFLTKNKSNIFILLPNFGYFLDFFAEKIVKIHLFSSLNFRFDTKIIIFSAKIHILHFWIFGCKKGVLE